MLAAWYFSADLATGRNLEYDEFYSLERSNGFDKFDDWLSVYSQNDRTAKKPPLQYWMVAAGRKAGLSKLLSLRLWSYLSFLGLLAVTAHLAFLLSDRNTWSVPTTMILLCCSTQVVKLGRSGMLDMGMSFLMMASAWAFVLAKNTPRYWLLCGFLVGLGSLQKGPIAFFLLVLLILILSKRKDQDYSWSVLRANPDFNSGLKLTVAMILSWPLLQTFRYGPTYWTVAFYEEMIARFAPVGNRWASEGHVFSWFSLLWSDIGILSLLALTSLVLVFSLKRLRERNLLLAIAAVTIIISLAFCLARGTIYPRYLVALTPLLVLLSVLVMNELIPYRFGMVVIAVGFLGVSYPDVNSAVVQLSASDRYSEVKRRVSYIDKHLQDGEIVVLDRSLIPPGAYGYFGKSTRRFFSYKFVRETELKRFAGEVVEMGPRHTYIGFTDLTNEDAISALLGPIDKVEIIGDRFVWRYRSGDKLRSHSLHKMN